MFPDKNLLQSLQLFVPFSHTFKNLARVNGLTHIVSFLHFIYNFAILKFIVIENMFVKFCNFSPVKFENFFS